MNTGPLCQPFFVVIYDLQYSLLQAWKARTGLVRDIDCSEKLLSVGIFREHVTSVVSPFCGSMTSNAGVKCSVMLTTGPCTGSAWYGATDWLFCCLRASGSDIRRDSGDLSGSDAVASPLASLSTGTMPSNSQAKVSGSEERGFVNDILASRRLSSNCDRNRKNERPARQCSLDEFLNQVQR